MSAGDVAAVVRDRVVGPQQRTEQPRAHRVEVTIGCVRCCVMGGGEGGGEKRPHLAVGGARGVRHAVRSAGWIAPRRHMRIPGMPPRRHREQRTCLQSCMYIRCLHRPYSRYDYAVPEYVRSAARAARARSDPYRRSIRPRTKFRYLARNAKSLGTYLRYRIRSIDLFRIETDAAPAPRGRWIAVVPPPDAAARRCQRLRRLRRPGSPAPAVLQSSGWAPQLIRTGTGSRLYMVRGSCRAAGPAMPDTARPWMSVDRRCISATLLWL
eukprot:SAG31_NODE_2274_length_6037_cov_18.022061_1_plen_267_part_00